jgi:hypothetical protein
MANNTCEQLLAIEARWGREGRRAFLKALFARDDLVVCVWEDADAPDGDGIDMLVVKGQRLILAGQPVTWAAVPCLFAKRAVAAAQHSPAPGELWGAPHSTGILEARAGLPRNGCPMCEPQQGGCSAAAAGS